MSDRCLIVTHLDVSERYKLSSGVHRRLGMLVEAVCATGVPVRLFCTLAPNAESGPATDRRIAEGLKEAWGLDLDVVAHPRESGSRWAPWLLTQVIGIVRPTHVRGVFSPEMCKALASELARRPSFVLAHRLPAMTALLELRTPLPPVYFDVDDLLHRLVYRSIPLLTSKRDKLFDAASLPAITLGERRAIRAAARAFVCSTGDASIANRLSGKKNTAVVPNAVAIQPVAPRASGAVMLMVGIYSYEPNADGAEYFITEVLPLIRARKPDAELWLVGASPESISSHKRLPDGVRFMGFVDDIKAAYASARVVVCPIRFGGGTRVKLVEAAAAGKAIVTTTIGAEGLGMVPDRQALFADDPQAFADACVRLIDDDALVDRLGASARDLASASYDRQRIVASLTREFQASV